MDFSEGDAEDFTLDRSKTRMNPSEDIVQMTVVDNGVDVPSTGGGDERGRATFKRSMALTL